MARIFPKLISADDVSGLLSELADAVPYTDDEWQTASLDFNSIDLGINIRLANRDYQNAHRQRVACVIRLLPELQASVISTMMRPTVEDPNDDHELSWIDIDFDDGEVDLCFNGISCNTQWNQSFRVSSDGKLIS